jgi:hypothetical protein
MQSSYCLVQSEEQELERGRERAVVRKNGY